MLRIGQWGVKSVYVIYRLSDEGSRTNCQRQETKANHHANVPDQRKNPHCADKETRGVCIIEDSKSST